MFEALCVPVEQRVIRRLLDVAELYAAPGREVLISLIQGSLAELAEASRATVNQFLRGDEEQGVFDFKRGRTRIRDLGPCSATR